MVYFSFFCLNLFCTIANLRIKCVTETKNVSGFFYKNVTLRFLYILGCSGPLCGTLKESPIEVQVNKFSNVFLHRLNLRPFSLGKMPRTYFGRA